MANDFWGSWKVVAGADAGASVHIDARAIRSELSWLRLRIDSVRLEPGGELELDGEHAGLLVHVRLTPAGPTGAHLSWNDGATFPAELRLER